MPYLLPPVLVTVLRLVAAPAAHAPANTDEVRPRLETTALGAQARQLAADVLCDADAIADLELIDRAAVFEVDLHGDRHELRLELAQNGDVVGASVWWTGSTDGAHHFDVGPALDAIAQSTTLDAVMVEDDAIILRAGHVRVPIGEDRSDPDVVPVWSGGEG
jgi:hypothetical protein